MSSTHCGSFWWAGEAWQSYANHQRRNHTEFKGLPEPKTEIALTSHRSVPGTLRSYSRKLQEYAHLAVANSFPLPRGASWRRLDQRRRSRPRAPKWTAPHIHFGTSPLSLRREKLHGL